MWFWFVKMTCYFLLLGIHGRWSPFRRLTTKPYIGSTPPPKIPVTTEGLLYRELPNVYTPQKTKMEPENHPFEEEQHLPDLHLWVPNVKFRGCNVILVLKMLLFMGGWTQLSDVKKDTAPEAVGVSKTPVIHEKPEGKMINYITPRKINMEQNHGGLEDHFPF